MPITCTYIHTYIHIYIHIFKYTYIHTYIHIYIQQINVIIVNLIYVNIYIPIALFHCLSSLPYASKLPVVPFAGEITVVVALWVQASPVCTDIVKSYIGPLLNKVIECVIPLAKIGGDGNGNSLGGIAVIAQPLLFVLKSTGFLNTQIEDIIKSSLQDSLSLLLVVFFCLTPWKVANIGVVVIGFIIPAYNTSLVTSSTSSYNHMQALKMENTPMVHIYIYTYVHIYIFTYSFGRLFFIQIKRRQCYEKSH